MYGQIAGAGMAAGVPTVLAFTGVTGPGFAVLVVAALVLVATGIALLRRGHRRS